MPAGALRVALAVTLALAATPVPLHAADQPAATGKSTQSSWPLTVVEARAEADAKGKPEPGWPAQEIELARAHCTHVLQAINAVSIPEPPIRHGECGTPAPIRLVSFGRNPEVVISPPAVVTCDMAVALHTWFKDAVQPLARKHLAGPVVKIESMSDYSCRNAYGRVKTRLSEHGRANALDIRGFQTQSGGLVTVLDHWGMTSREIAAAIAAEKKAAAKAAAERAVAEAAARHKAATAKAQPAASEGSAAVAQRSLTVPPDVLNRRTLIEGLPRVTIGNGGSAGDSAAPTATFDLNPSKLGGPKQPPEKNSAKAKTEQTEKTGKKQLVKKAAATPSPPAPEAKATFLRNSHEAACRIFGTVLGPEANNAHRNHFHVDMAERSTGAFCE